MARWIDWLLERSLLAEERSLLARGLHCLEEQLLVLLWCQATLTDASWARYPAKLETLVKSAFLSRWPNGMATRAFFRLATKLQTATHFGIVLLLILILILILIYVQSQWLLELLRLLLHPFLFLFPLSP